MKGRICIIIFFISFMGGALAKQETTTLSIIEKNQNHLFSIIHDNKSKKYELKFQIDKQKPLLLSLTKDQASYFKNQVNDLSWSTQYKNIRPPSKCVPYLKLTINNESSTICNDDHKSVGKSYGLLTQLRKIVEQDKRLINN